MNISKPRQNLLSAQPREGNKINKTEIFEISPITCFFSYSYFSISENLSPSSTNKVKFTKLVLKEPTAKSPRSPGKSKITTVRLPTSPVSYTKSILNDVTSKANDLSRKTSSRHSDKIDDTLKRLEEQKEFIAITSEFNDYLTETMRREEEKYERRPSLAEELALADNATQNRPHHSAISVGFDDSSETNDKKDEEEQDEFLLMLEADMKSRKLGKYKDMPDEENQEKAKPIQKSPNGSKNQNLDKSNKVLAKSDPVISRPDSGVTFKTSDKSPDTKNSRKTSFGSLNSARTLEMCKKDKPYDPEAAREFMKKQKERRKTEGKENATGCDKDVIKQRLEELRKNTRNIVNRNVAKSKSAGNTPKKEQKIEKPVVPQKTFVQVFDVKPKVQKNEPEVRKSTGILKKPNEESKKSSPSFYGTPITENRLKVDASSMVSNESLNPSRFDLYERSGGTFPLKHKYTKPSIETLPFWLKHSTVRPYPYNFIWAVRKKLEALAAETELQKQQEGQKQKKVQIQHRQEVKIIETPKTTQQISGQRTLRKPLVESMNEDQHDGKKNRFSDFLMNKYINNPLETSKIELKKAQENESETNANTSSFQDPDGNTISEISSIKSDAVNSFPNNQLKKIDNVLMEENEDGDTTITESILQSSLEVSPIRKNNGKDAEGENNEEEDRLYITLHRGNLTSENKYSDQFESRNNNSFSMNNTNKKNNFLSSTKVSWDDIQMRGPSSTNKSPLTPNNVQTQSTPKFSMSSQEAVKYKQFSKSSKSSGDEFRYSDDFQKTSKEISKNSTIVSSNSGAESVKTTQKTNENLDISAKTIEDSRQTSFDSQKTITEESFQKSTSSDSSKKPLTPQEAFKKPQNIQTTSNSTKSKNLSTIVETQDENKENQDKNKETEYQKMLDAFNKSLSHVIEVNQMLYTALSEKSSSTKHSSSSRYQHSIASSRSMISSYNQDVSSVKSNQVPASEYSYTFEAENESGNDTKATSKLVSETVNESKTLTPSNDKSIKTPKKSSKKDSTGDKGESLSNDSSTIKTQVNEEDRENEKSFVVKYTDNSGVLKNYHENNLNMMKEQQQKSQQNTSGTQERKEYSSATITTKTTTTTTKIHHQNIVNDDRSAGEETDVLAMFNYTDTEISFNGTVVTEMNCSYSNLGMVSALLIPLSFFADVLKWHANYRVLSNVPCLNIEFSVEKNSEIPKLLEYLNILSIQPYGFCLSVTHLKSKFRFSSIGLI